MLDNILVYFKIAIFLFLRGYSIIDDGILHKLENVNFNIKMYILQDIQRDNLDNKKIYIYANHKYDDISRGSCTNSIYIVQPGDTLFYIGWITGNNYIDLAKRNNIKNINILKVGQSLLVRVDNSNVITLFMNKLLNNLYISLYKGSDKVKKMLFFIKKKINFLNVNRDISSDVELICSVVSNTNKFNRTLIRNSWNWPTNGYIINTFSNIEGGNKGIDISGIFDQPILAATTGKVIYVGNILKGYGNLIIIKHFDNYLSAYAHNNKILVVKNQQVKIGEQIATMGSSDTNEVKLHFEIRYAGKSIDPLFLLPKY